MKKNIQIAAVGLAGLVAFLVFAAVANAEPVTSTYEDNCAFGEDGWYTQEVAGYELATEPETRPSDVTDYKVVVAYDTAKPSMKTVYEYSGEGYVTVYLFWETDGGRR
jgi:predicted neutral ceramidase superfamily lipid hydrolase